MQSRSYRQSFIQGVFFGMGTFVGGTIIIAIVVWFLSWFADIPGAVGEFVEAVIKTLNKQ
ncbi:MAG: DUF5665 domain-containing protein [Candidatus Nomurabacteria bacterium]|nr:DUF5665 domain-containing protein [Candidatus Nomurabacteria bacterium]